MATITLTASPRTVRGKQVKRLRAAGMVPANLYGRGIASQPLQIPAKELEHVMKQAGTTALVELHVEAEPQRTVMLRQIRHDYISGAPLHVDLYEVKMDQPIVAEVPLHFVGEAPAIKNVGGIVLPLLTHLRVRALPAHVPATITVDQAPLAAIGDALHVRDLPLPDGVEVLAEADEMVAKVNAPHLAVEEVEEAVEAPAQETPAAEGEQPAEAAESR